MKVTLASSTVPRDLAGMTPGEVQWREEVANWPAQPGQFAFFVFRADTDFPLLEYAIGLNCKEVDGGCYIAGTADDLAMACLSYCVPDSPEDVIQFYNYVHTKLTDWGYRTLGRKRPTLYGYTLSLES